jgi:hypothetical protein
VYFSTGRPINRVFEVSAAGKEYLRYEKRAFEVRYPQTLRVFEVSNKGI